MFSPFDPRTVLIVHKEKEARLLREIEMNRIIKERRALAAGGSLAPMPAWYAMAAQWVTARLFHRAPMPQPGSMRPEPCYETPC